MSNTPIPGVMFPKNWLGSGIVFCANPELLTSFELPGGRMIHVPLAEVESIEAGFRAGPVEVDKEWRLYVVTAFGRRVDVELGWSSDSYTWCSRPNGLTPDQEAVVEAVIKRLADAQWDADCEVSGD